MVFTIGFIVSFNFNNPIVKLDAGVKYSVGSVWFLEIKKFVLSSKRMNLHEGTGKN